MSALYALGPDYTSSFRTQLEQALDVRSLSSADEVIKLVTTVWQPTMDKLQLRMSEKQLDAKLQRVLTGYMYSTGIKGTRLSVITTEGGSLPDGDGLITIRQFKKQSAPKKDAETEGMPALE